MIEKNNYLDVVYNEQDRPWTEYPDKLTSYLFETYELKKNHLIKLMTEWELIQESLEELL